MDEAIAAAKGRVALVKVNIDNAGKLADEHRIEYVPTILLFRRGKRISEWDGRPDSPTLEEWMEG